jgi:hypothetical protein
VATAVPTSLWYLIDKKPGPGETIWLNIEGDSYTNAGAGTAYFSKKGKKTETHAYYIQSDNWERARSRCSCGRRRRRTLG